MKAIRPLKVLPGYDWETDVHLLADLDIGELVLVDLHLDPDGGEVGNVEEDVSRVDVLPLLDHLFDDYAGERRVDRQGGYSACRPFPVRRSGSP